jgi:hypothetical protein
MIGTPSILRFLLMHRPLLPSVNTELLQNQPVVLAEAKLRAFLPKMDVWLSFTKVLTVLMFTLSLMGYWAGLGWFADLASCFKVQYAILLTGAFLVLLIRPNWAWLLLAVLGLGI